MANAVYFLTGTTGFLGGEFLQTVLAQDPTAQCYCLIRDQGQLSAAQRLADMDRVFVVPGDITLDNLGLSTEAYQALAQKITHIVHMAALVKFEKPKAVLNKINVRGTEQMIQFAQACQKENPDFKVLAYVSTAYVGGKHHGIITEQDVSAQLGFKNEYEATKFTAEALIREVQNTLPVMIFRPSIILGHSKTGAVTRNNVIFPLVQVAKKYHLGLFPANKNCLLDVVSVDYVAQGIYFLLQDPSLIGQAFHLTCGAGNEITVKQQVKLMNQIYGLHMNIIPSWLWPIGKTCIALTQQGRYIVQGIAPYRLYINDNPQFCSQYTQNLLNKYQLSATNTSELLQKTLLFIEHKFFS